ncbi:hypothetical protein [Rothia nasimurium]|uniref:hypothetical protein n=1 Tax=Rothia nasimurium TaxID=85336 RepID=UPI001F262B0A|nr:hypothetical protein [Rothia nasimurium]
MTIQQNSPGNSIYAPLIMWGLWGLHGFITWYLSRELAITLWAIGLVAVGTVLTQWFLRPKGSRTMVWRPGLFAGTLTITWVFWALLNMFWDIEVQHALAWPLIGYISSSYNVREASAQRRKARDIGV